MVLHERERTAHDVANGAHRLLRAFDCSTMGCARKMPEFGGRMCRLVADFCSAATVVATMALLGNML
jgi:hypothetical protein